MTVLVNETFDNTSMPLAAYNTFDVSIFDSTVRRGTSGYAVRWTWDEHDEEPNGVNTATRYEWTGTEQLYFCCWWRLGSDWVGSGVGFHPHLFYVIPELWHNLSGGDLRVYIELTGDSPRLIIGIGEATTWINPTADLALSTWHKIECWFEMNTVTDGVGNSDGVMKVWVNGTSIYNSSTIVYKNNDSYTFAAIALGPWISTGDGANSPQAQSMWIDDMLIATKIPVLENTSKILGYTAGVSAKFLGQDLINISKVMGN